MAENQIMTGGCFCGNIRYHISDEVIKRGVCHCRSCQHLTGGSSWPFIVVKSECLNISGDLKEFTRKGANGQVHLGLCPNCGSTLFARPEIWPHIRTVSASSLDNIESFLPDMHVWIEDAQAWVLFDPDVPQFKHNPEKK